MGMECGASFYAGNLISDNLIKKTNWQSIWFVSILYIDVPWQQYWVRVCFGLDYLAFHGCMNTHTGFWTAKCRVGNLCSLDNEPEAATCMLRCTTTDPC